VHLALREAGVYINPRDTPGSVQRLDLLDLYASGYSFVRFVHGFAVGALAV
jgi:hypothetical protein